MPGSTKLLVARVMLSVLETVENIYEMYGQVLCSINPHDLYVRRGWQSGFMGKLDFQNARPKKSNTCGYPFFESCGIQSITVTDSYMAVLICMLRFLCPEEYRDAMYHEMQKPFHERVTTKKMIENLLSTEWFESEGLSVRQSLKETMDVDFDSKGGRAALRLVLENLANTRCHKNHLQLHALYGDAREPSRQL